MSFYRKPGRYSRAGIFLNHIEEFGGLDSNTVEAQKKNGSLESTDISPQSSDQPSSPSEAVSQSAIILESIPTPKHTPSPSASELNSPNPASSETATSQNTHKLPRHIPVPPVIAALPILAVRTSADSHSTLKTPVSATRVCSGTDITEVSNVESDFPNFPPNPVEVTSEITHEQLSSPKMPKPIKLEEIARLHGWDKGVVPYQISTIKSATKQQPIQRSTIPPQFPHSKPPFSNTPFNTNPLRNPQSSLPSIRMYPSPLNIQFPQNQQVFYPQPEILSNEHSLTQSPVLFSPISSVDTLYNYNMSGSSPTASLAHRRSGSNSSFMSDASLPYNRNQSQYNVASSPYSLLSQGIPQNASISFPIANHAGYSNQVNVPPGRSIPPSTSMMGQRFVPGNSRSSLSDEGKSTFVNRKRTYEGPVADNLNQNKRSR
ncbi:hypothetical protein HK098_000387 [Nowakowskiella sp. JEL0407]|nr:hypothetical protein HK098_000387 [Nowakowskiella sp. JEL0407]